MRGVLNMCALVVTASILLAAELTSVPVAALTPESTIPQKVPTSPLKVSAYDIELLSSASGTVVEYHEVVRYIELYNDSDEPINLSEYALRVTNTNGIVLASASFNDQIPVRTGYLPPDSFVTVSFNRFVTGAQFDFAAAEVPYGSAKPLLDREVQLFHGGVGIYAKSVKLKVDNSEPQTRVTFRTVTAEDQAQEVKAVYDTPLYKPMTEFPLAPIEILANPKSCGPLDSDLACQEYIKFHNMTESMIDFTGSRLRVGFFGQSSTASNTTVLSGQVAPGGYAIFSLPISNSGGYVWLEDMFGVMPYENTVIEYPDASATSKKGLSWALINDTWQWATPTPGGANMPLVVNDEEVEDRSTLTPCRADQYRNPETNRCKLIASTSSSLKPCASNQYRSAETNRCRNIASSSSGSSLTPCAANQYRNPETNRCRLISSAASALKPCADNQVRNPETNRCRAVLGASMPTADFPVDQTDDSDDQSLGWIAFAGVGLMALGYAGWEWRYEIAGMFRKLKGLVPKA